MAIHLLAKEILKACFFARPGWRDPATRRQLGLYRISYFPKVQNMPCRGTEQREALMALYLHQGDSAEQACRNAGWGLQTARKMAYKIARRERVKTMLAQLGAGIPPNEIGSMAKAQLHRKLTKLPKDEKTALGYIRTGLEFEGLIGGPDVHLHEHNSLPPVVQKMLEDKMREILAVKGEVVDGAIVSEGAASEGQDQKDHDGA